MKNQLLGSYKGSSTPKSRGWDGWERKGRESGSQVGPAVRRQGAKGEDAGGRGGSALERVQPSLCGAARSKHPIPDIV